MHQLGCDSAQGYFFARPMAAEDFLQQFLDGRVDGARAAAPSR
jgi:EAL domain-containing protein (putative c-di-GMP-specific phosphodiesterase class I)